MNTSKRKSTYGWKGCLKDMPQLPLDLLFEIFRHVEPLDLLHLARTSKDFRSLLMSRESALLWQGARQNIEGLPGCPTFLSEPEFANLVFDSSCHVCLKPKVKRVVWEFRARYCAVCTDRMTVPWVDARKQLPATLRLHELMFSTRDPPIYSPSVGRVHAPDLLKLTQGWEETEADLQEEYLDSVVSQNKEIREFADACTAWVVAKKQVKEEKLGDIRDTRLENIVRHLSELGWDDELDRISVNGYRPLSRHRFARLSAPWNDQTWGKIQPHMIQAMEDIKQDRLSAERISILKARFAVLEVAALSFRRSHELRGKRFPRLRDIASFPEIRQIIEAPNEVTIQEEDFIAIESKIPNLVAQWEENQIRNLAGLVRQKATIPEDLNPSDLAIGQIYQCRQCRRGYEFPYVLGHQCFRNVRGKTKRVEYEDVADEFLWTNINLPLDPRVDIVKCILDACELDYTRCTAQEMDELGVRLLCLSCERLEETFREVMNWRAAAKHATYIEDFSTNPCKWQLVSVSKYPVIEELERAALTHQDSGWTCGHCTSVPFATLDDIRAHVQLIHSIDDPIMHVDFLVQIDYTPWYQPMYFIQGITLDDLQADDRFLVDTGVATFVDIS